MPYELASRTVFETINHTAAAALHLLGGNSTSSASSADRDVVVTDGASDAYDADALGGPTMTMSYLQLFISGMLIFSLGSLTSLLCRASSAHEPLGASPMQRQRQRRGRRGRRHRGRFCRCGREKRDAQEEEDEEDVVVHDKIFVPEIERPILQHERETQTGFCFRCPPRHMNFPH